MHRFLPRKLGFSRRKVKLEYYSIQFDLYNIESVVYFPAISQQPNGHDKADPKTKCKRKITRWEMNRRTRKCSHVSEENTESNKFAKI